MFCSKCGTKNEEGAKFCAKCGEALTESTEKNEAVKVSTPDSTNAGGIRKAIKADAKKRVKGALVGATAIYLVVCALIGGLSGGTAETTTTTGVNFSYQTTSLVAEIITLLIGVVFTFGLIQVAFKAVKDEEYKFTDVFVKPFEKLKALGYILLLTLIVFVATFVLMCIPIIGWIAFIILLFYLVPAFTVFMILLADPTSKEMSFVDTFKKSMEIVKGNRVEYYGMICSFIPWVLLAFITFGILFIWLTPYMQIAEVNLYRKWTGEETFTNNETGLSNGAVIGISAGGCGCGCLLAVTVFAASIAAIIAGLGVASNSPEVQDFINKYIPAEDRADVQNDLNEINDYWNNYDSGYNS